MGLTKITSRILDSSGVTILGTITTGVWQGSVIAEAYLQNQSGTNTGDQTNISGNAATATLADEATILANTRNINGVAFNGSTNITIADATKLPLAGGTLTGALVGTSAGFTRLDINATNVKLKGDLLGNADAAYDIGASGANRPRNLYLSNSISAADITTTGAGNFSGGGIFSSSSQGKLKLVAGSNEYLSLEFANASGTTQWEMSKNNTHDLYFYKGGYRMMLKADGKVGIGTTTFESSWTGYTVLKIGADNSIYGNTATNAGSAFFISQNLYQDSSNHKYVGAGSNEGGVIDLRNGTFTYSTAPAGTAGNNATITPRLSISNDGNATFSGKVKVSDGGNTTIPSFRVGSDTNGLSSPSTNQLNFITNSLTRLSISSAGVSTFDIDSDSKFIIGNGGTNAVTLYSGASQEIYMGSNGSYRLRFKTDGNIVMDNGGNLGIGTASPLQLLDVQSSSASPKIMIKVDGQGSSLTPTAELILGAGPISSNDSACKVYSFRTADYSSAAARSSGLKFQVTQNNGPRLAMTIKETGDVFLTATGGDVSSTVSGIALRNPRTSGPINIGSGNVTDSRDFVRFLNGNGIVGSISTNGSATVYATSSDYRLKENVTPITDALSRVNQLKPSQFNFIADTDKTVDGFIAHEVQEIIPEAISGEKDALNEDGTPKYQGIDQSKIVPLLTAAIQEQQTIIEDLKSRIETLEG